MYDFPLTQLFAPLSFLSDLSPWSPFIITIITYRGTPHAVVLDKGKLYRANSWEDIQDFAISEYELSQAEEIPPLPSGFDALLHPHPNNKMTIIAIVGSIVMVLLVLGARMLTPPPPSAVPASKKKN